jgi:hypothetical protein
MILLILAGSTVSAQNKRYQFKGTVLDKETRAPISGVNLNVAGTRRGCSTNLNGEFSMTVYSRPVFLNVSHLGYESKKLWLDSAMSTITILLNPASLILQELEIKAKNDPVPFFRDNKYSVLDYEVDSNLVYLLIYRFRLDHSELICKSVSGDTIAHTSILPFRPTGLFLDCMHNLHVLTADSVYQVFRRNGSIDISFAVDIKKFRIFLADCVISTDSLLFFRKESPDQLSVEFYQVNRYTSQKQLLSAVGDQKKLEMLRQNPEEYKYLVMPTSPRNIDEVITWQWLKKIVYKTNTSSLHQIDDILCVFNTADYTLELYTRRGEFSSRLKMPIPEITGAGRWTSEIHIDNIDHKAYTSFLTKGGNFTLYKVNLNTGELKLSLPAEHGFPRKIRVHHNFLFYLHDFPGEGDNKHLFRQKL